MEYPCVGDGCVGDGVPVVLDLGTLGKDSVDHRKKKGQEPADCLKSLRKEEELEWLEAVELEAVRSRHANLPEEAEGTGKCFGLRKIEVSVPNQPALPECYQEVKNLVGIKKNPFFAVALKEWERKTKLLERKVKRTQNRADNLKNELYNLVGFFSVFQGVLLTAVSQSHLLHCNNVWSPILLSVVASAVTVAGVIQKLTQIRSFQETIHSEEQSLKEVAQRQNYLRRLGVDKFRFAEFAYRKEKKQLIFRFWNDFFFIVGSTLILSVVFPISSWKILCDPGPNPYPIL